MASNNTARTIPADVASVWYCDHRDRCARTPAHHQPFGVIDS